MLMAAGRHQPINEEEEKKKTKTKKKQKKAAVRALRDSQQEKSGYVLIQNGDCMK